MSVLDQSVASGSLRRTPITIRLAPQFVNRLVARVQRTPVGRGEIAGLLFGTPDDPISIVQAFRSFSDSAEASGLREPARLAEAIDRIMATSRTDPEISALQLVGWYCVRPAGGLLGSDVDFHNLNFFRPTDIALVLRSEKEGELLMEVYSRYADALLSPEDHRWGALRLSTTTPVAGPVEVTMRAKVNDDFYLRAYGISTELDEQNKPSFLSKFLEPVSRKFLSFAGRAERLTLRAAPSKQPEPIAGLPPPKAVAKAAAAGASISDVVPLSAPRLRPLELSMPRSTAHTSELIPRPPTAPNIFAGDPPDVPALREQRTRSVPWGYSVLVFALAAGVTFAIVYVKGLPSGTGAPAFLRAILPASGLGLQLQTQGDRLLLSWNRLTPLVRTAREGILQIDDGTQHRQVRLDAGQIANGSVLYRPLSDDVSFRLEVQPQNGNPVSESVRVLDAPKAAVALDLSTAKPDSAPSPASTPAASPKAATGREWKVVAQTRSSAVSVPVPNPQASAPRTTTPPEIKSDSANLARNLTRSSQEATPAPTLPTVEPPPPQSSITPDGQHSNPPANTPPASSPVIGNPSGSGPGQSNTAGASSPPVTPVTSAEGTNTGAAGNRSSGANPDSTNSTPPNPGSTAPSNDTRPNASAPAPSASRGSNGGPVAQPDHAAEPPSTAARTDSGSTSQQNVPAPARGPESSRAEQSKPGPSTAQPSINGTPPAAVTGAANAFIAPRPLRQVLPDVKALAPGIVFSSPVIEVIVVVNPEGHVVSAQVPSRKKISSALLGASISAAKQWVFAPATLGGKPVQSQHTIVFQFRSSAK